MAQHVAHPDALARLFADVAQGGRDLRIAHGEDVAALSRRDADGRDEMRLLGRDALALHHGRQQRRGLPAGAARVEDHARQRRRRQGAKHLVVVHTEHGDLFGHGGLCAPAGLEHLLAAIIVARKHRDRSWQSAQPGCNGVDFGVAVDRRARRPEDVPAAAVTTHQQAELLAAPRSPAEPGFAAKSKMPEAALEEMLRRQAGDGGVVGLYPRRPAQKARRCQVDHGRGELRHRPGDAPAFSPEHHPVSIPAIEPLGWCGLGAERGEMHAPRSVAQHVVPDSQEQVARIRIGRLEEQRDLQQWRRSSHPDMIRDLNDRSNVCRRGGSSPFVWRR